MQFRIEDMTCGGCVRRITKAVQSVDPDAIVDADVAGRQLRVSSAAPEAQIAAALEGAGYPPRQVTVS